MSAPKGGHVFIHNFIRFGGLTMKSKLFIMTLAVAALIAFSFSGCLGGLPKKVIHSYKNRGTNQQCLPPWQDGDGEDGGPEDLIAIPIGEGRIALSWWPPSRSDESQPAAYTIYGTEWDGEAGMIIFEERASVSGTSMIFDDLTIGQLYAFQVAIGEPGGLKRSNIASAQACE